MNFVKIIAFSAITTLGLGSCGEDSPSAPGQASNVDDLQVISESVVSARLSWTVLKRVGSSSTASHEIRYSTDKGLLEAWNNASKVVLPYVNSDNRTADTATIEHLNPETVYYFAVREATAEGQLSEISNIVQTTTTADFSVDFPDSALRAVVLEKLGKDTLPIYYSELYYVDSLVAFVRGIADLEGLQFVDQLRYLSITDSGLISSINPLGNLANLEMLRLDYMAVSDLSPLSGLSHLWFLALSGESITSIQPIGNLTDLRIFFLGPANVSNLDALTTLQSLQDVRITENKVSNLSPFTNHSTLGILELRSNLIQDIAPLTGLPSLYLLDLSGNNISNINPVCNLPSLSGLTFTDNNISDISSLSCLGQLVSVGVSKNPVSDLTSLQNMSNLNFVNADSTSITEITALIQNSSFGVGARLQVRYNNLSQQALNSDIPALQARGVEVLY